MVLIALLSFFLYKKMYKSSIAIIIIVGFSVVFMPVKFTENNMAVHEGEDRFQNIPEKVVVKDEKFSEYQERNFSNLKNDSKTQEK